ncbi:hypothetical protein DPMN_148802 [Dreissena polymorpha]|uniref:Peptidase M12A domain-containing protein n=1 Tax=Dreissena polymorpha TaxID=45954 RepID=A0A9D4FCL2_DREPO|nr:hypothetical protein DPMN_148802 [Dreissena polymorpha]
MKGSNRTLVQLHYDMVIDERTYKDGFRKDVKHKGVSCETHSVVSQTANRRRRIASKSEDNRWPLEIPYQTDTGFGKSCESFVGRLKGPQYIFLHKRNCMTLPIILHEIVHAIVVYTMST